MDILDKLLGKAPGHFDAAAKLPEPAYVDPIDRIVSHPNFSVTDKIEIFGYDGVQRDITLMDHRGQGPEELKELIVQALGEGDKYAYVALLQLEYPKCTALIMPADLKYKNCDPISDFMVDPPKKRPEPAQELVQN